LFSKSKSQKGKGLLTTYWLNPGRGEELDIASPLDISESTDASSRELGHRFETSVKYERLIGWVTELLLRHIQKIVSNAVMAICDCEVLLVVVADSRFVTIIHRFLLALAWEEKSQSRLSTHLPRSPRIRRLS
jgi:hypothetical protein